ncbi:TetR/AcrR family transcriptional regulator [Streptomyces sp. Z26]|uniref:TetR/AcrR family transcriptional regulator n=1 Tax=Streptomyces sp. Z26 TaxID=2500177 RepID=UPI000EF15391|nr:TetR/AcrR family transcriptional regulator [Streptomyces sp. Z26]RLL69770.1 TetR/AcrR family transcriptional regulator [Streptomyces sp. Z26]
MESGAHGESGTATPHRERAILDAATKVFLRFGYRKTSMDEAARAAGLSRQGLYLHFPTKQALFHAVLERMVERVRAAALAALAREDTALERRLADAVSALNGEAAGASSSTLAELLRTATTLGGPLLEGLHDDVTAAVADLLRRTGVAALWQDAGLSAEQLAEHLYLMASAVASSDSTAAEQRAALDVAARLVTRGHPG